MGYDVYQPKLQTDIYTHVYEYVYTRIIYIQSESFIKVVITKIFLQIMFL